MSLEKGSLKTKCFVLAEFSPDLNPMYPRQCTAIYGEDLFGRIHSHLKEARSRSVPHEDEAGVVAGLRALTANTRDCFLVDQLVFLEKQV